MQSNIFVVAIIVVFGKKIVFIMCFETTTLPTIMQHYNRKPVAVAKTHTRHQTRGIVVRISSGLVVVCQVHDNKISRPSNDQATLTNLTFPYEKTSAFIASFRSYAYMLRTLAVCVHSTKAASMQHKEAWTTSTAETSRAATTVHH